MSHIFHPTAAFAFDLCAPLATAEAVRLVIAIAFAVVS
jgi:hypothetical protein